MDESRKLKPDHAKLVPAATHKFALGAHVILVGKSDSTVFKVTRLLPDGGSGFQYRIKNDQEGHDRVASERLLTAVRR